MSEPIVVAYAESGNREALLAGKAVGPVHDTDEWSVVRIVPDGEPEMTLTFVSEETARAYWHEHGGQLMCTKRESWTLAPGWQERADA